MAKPLETVKAWPPEPVSAPDTALVRVVHDGRIKLVRLCDLIDPAMSGKPSRT